MNKLKLHKFDRPDDLCKVLADQLSDVLMAAISKRGRASLAVSGGSTPKKFFQTLSTSQIDWEKVYVTLVDERWVGQDNPRSNGRMVRENLLINRAAAAKFVALYTDKAPLELAVQTLEAELRQLPLPLDAVILGMGLDGHSASFFPDASNLDQAVNPQTTNLLSPVYADTAGEPRITLTLPAITASKFIALHIEGVEKLAVFQEAQNSAKTGSEADQMPIRHIMHGAGQLEVYWAP